MIKKESINIVKNINKPIMKPAPKPVIKPTAAPIVKPEKIVKEKRKSQTEIEQALIDNFINLQKVLTNLSIKFDGLSGNISKLLQLFEISAKSFTEKYPKRDIKEIEEKEKADKEFLKKLDSLMDQNKTIARGIMLMEEQIRNRNEPELEEEIEEEPRPPMFGVLKPKPLPKP